MWSQTDPAATEMIHPLAASSPSIQTPTTGLLILDQFNAVHILIMLFVLHFNIIFQFICKYWRFVSECLLELRNRKVQGSQIFSETDYSWVFPYYSSSPGKILGGKKELKKAQRRFSPMFFAIHHSHSIHFFMFRWPCIFV